MIEVKHSQLYMDLINGTAVEIKNPLRTTFDLADVYVSSRPEKLTSSCVYHSWDEQDEMSFKDQLGIWVIPTNLFIFLHVSVGGRDALPARFSALAGADMGDAMFFLLPNDMRDQKNVSLKITLICMN